MEQYTATTSGDQIMVHTANGQIQQQVRANVNRLVTFNMEKNTLSVFYLFSHTFLNVSKL